MENYFHLMRKMDAVRDFVKRLTQNKKEIFYFV